MATTTSNEVVDFILPAQICESTAARGLAQPPRSWSNRWESRIGAILGGESGRGNGLAGPISGNSHRRSKPRTIGQHVAEYGFTHGLRHVIVEARFFRFALRFIVAIPRDRD